MMWYREKRSVDSEEILEEDSSLKAYFIYAIVMSVVTVSGCLVYVLERFSPSRSLLSPQVIVLLVVLVMRKRIELVMQLFREAGKAVCAMPVLLFQPILVSINQFCFLFHPRDYYKLSLGVTFSNTFDNLWKP